MKNTLLLIILIVLTFSSFSQENFEALRIDYMHSGDHEKEEIDIYRIVAEPYFSRNNDYYRFPFNYGNYKIEVTSAESNELQYSYHYNTLFNEWKATKMAKEDSRTFQESVKIPYPETKSIITFFSRNDNLEWTKEYSYTINPESDFIIRENPVQHGHEKIHNAGNYKSKMDLVIIPDGYTKAEMEKFRKDAGRFRDYLLNCAPFSEHKNKINIWSIHLPSPESGTDKPTKSQWRKTALNTSFNTFGSQRYLTTYDHFALREAAAVTPYDLMFILVNDSLYGGGGIFNFYSISSSDDKNADFLMVHEFGHHFAALGDEYYTSDVAVDDYHNPDTEPFEPNITTLVDFESKWKDMVDKETPIPTPAKDKYKNTVGAYEGGGYVEKGVYRPYIDCTMKSAQYDNFCPVCQRAIRKMIKYYTGQAIR
ncbi:MAG: IgA Peptidase M64 [Bacteroidales bacterium]|nr:IgA Peptidase M64 [Bacteroidales bacterium]MCF8327470.1 IgA Peptidase M64 [Bacteroidales bacterium]